MNLYIQSNIIKTELINIEPSEPNERVFTKYYVDCLKEGGWTIEKKISI